MSQKHSLNSVALAAVFALAIFVVAFALFVFVGGYSVFGSIFMAFMVALLAGIVLFIGFGTPSGPAIPASARVAAPAAPAPPPAAPVPEADAASEADEAAAARQRAEEEEAAEAARLKAEAEARRSVEEQAAREKAEADAKAAEEAEAARKAAEAAAAAETAAAAEAASTPDYDGDGVREGTDEGTRPAGLDAPRDGKADDLKLIKGIGPKLEKLCNRLGFWHFDQVAAWTDDEVAWVDANLEGFKGRVTRDEWVAQAKVLAGGGETEFSKRVEDGDVY